MSSPYDLVIIGSGSTAFAAALRAESVGARVLMVEKSILGGTCINWGCVPSKTLIHGADLRHGQGVANLRGILSEERSLDFKTLMAHKDRVVQHLRQTRYVDLLQNNQNIEVIKGTGRFVSPRELQVDDLKIACDRFLIATGGEPRVIDFPGLNSVDYLTSRTALLLRKYPRSLVILGGGVIAVELGQMFLRMGTEVTILEHGPQILPQIDGDVTDAVRQALAEEGMKIHTSTSICSLAEDGGKTIVTAIVGGEMRTFAAERLLMATGTAPASRNIGLEMAGVATDDRGFIVVDSRMQTSAPGIWAAGDVVGGMMIATVGAREGIVAVDSMFQPDCGCKMDYLTVPMAVFTDPEVGIVGHTEATAREAGHETTAATIPASAIPKAHVTGNTAGMIKIVADAATRRILGVHLVCHRGADIINEAALAVRCRLTTDDLAASLHVYPSMAEGLRLCAQAFSRDITRLSCCAE